MHSRAGTKGTEVWKKERAIRDEGVGREARKQVGLKMIEGLLREARREERPGRTEGESRKEKSAGAEAKAKRKFL